MVKGRIDDGPELEVGRFAITPDRAFDAAAPEAQRFALPLPSGLATDKPVRLSLNLVPAEGAQPNSSCPASPPRGPKRGASVRTGGPYDRWEFEVRGGLLGVARVRAAVEEHGAGQQLARHRVWSVLSPVWLGLTLISAGLAGAAFLTSGRTAGFVMGAVCLALQLRALDETSAATGAVLHAVEPRPADTQSVAIPAERSTVAPPTPWRARPSGLDDT